MRHRATLDVPGDAIHNARPVAGEGRPLLATGRRVLRWRWTRPLLSSALGVLLLAYVLRSVPLGDLADHLRPQHPEPMIALLALVLAAQLVRAVRWRWLLSPLADVALADAFWINAASGLMNYVVPIRAGEAARMLWLSRRHRVAPGTALGCLVVDHTFDLCGVILVLGTGAVLGATAAARTPSVATLLLALGAAVAMLLLIWGSAAFGPRLAGSRLVPARFSRRLMEHAVAFRAATGLTRSPRRIAGLAIFSAAAVLFDGLAFAMLLNSLGLAVSAVSAVVAQVTILYATVLPSAPGYLGSLEAAGTLVLSQGLGLGAGSAAGAMLVWHAAGAAIIIGVGALALVNLRGQFALRV